jgi:hypothetical protein
MSKILELQLQVLDTSRAGMSGWCHGLIFDAKSLKCTQNVSFLDACIKFKNVGKTFLQE